MDLDGEAQRAEQHHEVAGADREVFGDRHEVHAGHGEESACDVRYAERFLEEDPHDRHHEDVGRSEEAGFRGGGVLKPHLLKRRTGKERKPYHEAGGIEWHISGKRRRLFMCRKDDGDERKRA